MSFYNGNGHYEDEILRHFASTGSDDQLFVCTDIQYGSVNQRFVREVLKWETKNIFILSGINLPLLLEVITTSALITKEMLVSMVEKAAKQIVFVDVESLADEQSSNDLF